MAKKKAKATQNEELLSAEEAEAIQALDFEAALEALQNTVDELEAGEAKLDRALGLYAKGLALSKRCSTLLEAAELQVSEVKE